MNRHKKDSFLNINRFMRYFVNFILLHTSFYLESKEVRCKNGKYTGNNRYCFGKADVERGVGELIPPVNIIRPI